MILTKKLALYFASLILLFAVSPAPSTEMIFSDEFNGTALDTTKWVTCLYSRGTSSGSECKGYGTELQYYRSANVTVSGGALHLTAKKETTVGYDGITRYYTSGTISTGRIYSGANKFQFSCGYAEARIKASHGLGTWAAFWTLEQYGSATSPLQENDIFEYLGRVPNVVYHHHHAPESGDRSSRVENAETDWHVYGSEWTLGRVIWYVDGIETGRFTNSGITCDPQYLMFNLKLGGWGGAVDDSALPTELQVDWVRVYAARPAPQTLYVSQSGSGTACTETAPCTFATAEARTDTNIVVLGTITNPVTWNRSGSALAPITISGGTFAAPLSPIGVYALKINGAYVNVVGATVTSAQEAGVWLAGGNGSVRDSDISNAGLGVKVTSANNLVTGNYIHDLHMVKNTSGGNDDFGAVGVMLNNAANNEVSYNRMIRCQAPSYDYGTDGGTVEWWGMSDNNYVHHNYAEGNDSFSEIGGGSANGGRLEYNISVNSGRFVAMHLGGTFASVVNGFVVKNNTVVQIDREWAVIGFIGAAPTAATLNVTNNIFAMNSDIFSNYFTFSYSDNVYWGAFRSFTLHTGDRIVDPLFTEDHHLQAGSLAAGAGAYPEPLSAPPTVTPSITPSPTYTPTITPSPTPTPTSTPTATPTLTPTIAPTLTPTEPPTSTLTPIPTPICILLNWDGTWRYCQ